jgi:hypothetical protein
MSGCGGGLAGPGPGPNQDFSITVTPGAVTASPGGSSTPTTITITGMNGFNGVVIISITGLPAGASTSPSLPFTLVTGAGQQLTIGVPANALAGNLALTVTGTSGAVNHSASLVLTISGTAPPGSDQFVVVGHSDSTNFPTTPGALAAGFLGGSGDGTVSSIRLSGGASNATFSTYFGGNAGEQIRDAFVDAQGNIYITGHTASPNISSLLPGSATAGVHRTACNACSSAAPDAFVAKFAPNGQVLRFTYFGGTGHDEGYSIFVDSAGAIYVGGRTASPDFPVTGAQIPQRNYAGGTYDFHVTKFTADLSTIVWATFVGGSDEDTGRGRLAVDNSGNVYISGETRSTNFLGAPGLNGVSDGVVVKLNPNGGLVYSVRVGGNNAAIPEGAPGGLVVTGAGEAYTCGLTTANDLPVTTARTFSGPTEGFAVRLSATGQVLALTYLGGNGEDQCDGLSLDASGNVILLSTTNSTTFPITAGVLRTAFAGVRDFAVTRLSPNLATILTSTYVGSSGEETGDTLRAEMDVNGNIVFTGLTNSSVFPVTPNAAQGVFRGGRDMVLVVLSADFRQILYATYLGGNGQDTARSVRYHRN